MTIKSLLIAIPLLVLGWLAILVAITLITDEAPARIVLFPSETFIDNLPPDIAITSISDFSISLRSDREGFADTLYRSGAWIVLPAGLTGCASISRSNSGRSMI